MLGFTNKDIRVLVSKPSIAGWGMNWQNCHNIIFVGLSDSFEAYYQAVRRCWRFGQTNEVNVHIIIAEKEGAVKANIERKQANAQKMTAELVKYTKDILRNDIQSTVRISESYIATENMDIPMWLKCGGM
jgi:SNF2 family DNA or RNA helicase